MLIGCTFYSFAQANNSYKISIEKVSNQRINVKQNINNVFGNSNGILQEKEISTRIYDGISSTYYVDESKTSYITYEIDREGMIDNFQFHYKVNDNMEVEIENANKIFNDFYIIFKSLSNSVKNAEILEFDIVLTDEFIQAIDANNDNLVRFQYANNNTTMSQCYFLEDKEIILFFK